VSLRQRYLTILAQLGPAAGAVGLTAVLGATAPAAASEPPSGAPAAQAAGQGVSERLAAVREAVSALAADESTAADPAERIAWWGNGWGGGWRGGGWGWRPGWGFPNWNNWNNWHNWGNWGRNW